MDDLISRQAAINEIRKCRFVVDAIERIKGLPSAQPEKCEDAVSREEATWVVFCHRDHVEDQVNAIDELPSVRASAQEVVRCKDCKYRKKNIHYTIPLIDRVESIVFCLRNMRSVNGNGFCSDGERAEA